MATVKLMLNKSRVSKDELFPLVFQVIHQRKKKLIYVGHRIEASQFDSQKRRVVSHATLKLSSYHVKKINQDIKFMEQRILRVINLFESRGIDYTVNQIVGQVALEQDNLKDLFLFSYFDQRISFKQKLGKVGIMAAYQSTRSSLEHYWGSVDIRLSEVTSHFVIGYQEFLQANRVSSNTIAYYMRNFRTIYNYALNENAHLDPGIDPFRSIITQPAKTIKRALKREDLVRMVLADFSNRPSLDFARDLFLFSFYTRGMSMVDIIYLKKENIKDDVLTYSRHKTGQTLSVQLTDQLKELIAKYDNDSVYLLPFMAEGAPEEQYKVYRKLLRRINNGLKALAKELDIDHTLTSYVARHSWATLAKESGAPISVISEGLGHTSEKTTMIYLKQFDRSVLDQVNEIVTKLK